MKAFRIFLLVLIVIGLILLFTQAIWVPKLVNKIILSESGNTTSVPGMTKYTDSSFGFSFWYPSALPVTSIAMQDNANFPGGVAVETLQIGAMGGTSIIVVNSPTSSITDEPANHASPIAQTEYYYNNTSKQWMVAFPEGNNTGKSAAPTAANISKTTISGLVMLPSGRRFDTTIIPLNTTRFLVVSDGGGSSFTSQLAQTVAQVGASIATSTLTTALQAEVNAYAPL